MTVFARFSTLFVILAAVTPIFAANAPRTFNHGGNDNHGGGNGGQNGCKSNEFWYKKKGCCLPSGGPPSPPPPPPSGSDCPPSGFYWHKGQGCCVPNHNPPDDTPPPQCRKGWNWSALEFKCCPEGTTTTHNPPHPSKTPGHDDGGHNGGHSGGHNGGHNHKRTMKSRAALLCPTGLEACPIAGSVAGEYECMETAYDLKSCGGCASIGQGQDCTAIPGAWNVACDQGVCAVHTCAQGFVLAKDKKSCHRP